MRDFSELAKEPADRDLDCQWQVQHLNIISIRR